jgi:hypothetical protein
MLVWSVAVVVIPPSNQESASADDLGWANKWRTSFTAAATPPSVLASQAMS